MSEAVEQHVIKRYQLIKKVGSGAYGHVWKVLDRQTSKLMALKKIFDAFQHATDAQRTYRQIILLRYLQHPNIVKLRNVIKSKNDKDLYLVFDFMEADLHSAIRQKILKDVHLRFITYQIVKSIKFIHSASIIHRDLKPSNILINSDCLIKICDFGLARTFISSEINTQSVMTEQVATRWYRAPEVLLGSKKYSKSADIWSLGCILGELFLGRPMFAGQSTLHQLQKIISFTGKPNKKDIQSLNVPQASIMIQSLVGKQRNTKQLFDNCQVSSDGLDLLNKLLQFSPSNRLSLEQILIHPYISQFNNYSEPQTIQTLQNQPILCEDEGIKLTVKQYKVLIYQHIKNHYNYDQNNQDKKIQRRTSASNSKELLNRSEFQNKKIYKYDSNPTLSKNSNHKKVGSSTLFQSQNKFGSPKKKESINANLLKTILKMKQYGLKKEHKTNNSKKELKKCSQIKQRELFKNYQQFY